MKLTTGTNNPDIATLAAVIARSQIVVTAVRSDSRRLPAGFDDIDIAILEWIAAEGRRAARSGRFAPM